MIQRWLPIVNTELHVESEECFSEQDNWVKHHHQHNCLYSIMKTCCSRESSHLSCAVQRKREIIIMKKKTHRRAIKKIKQHTASFSFRHLGHYWAAHVFNNGSMWPRVSMRQPLTATQSVKFLLRKTFRLQKKEQVSVKHAFTAGGWDVTHISKWPVVKYKFSSMSLFVLQLKTWILKTKSF